jgi:hypothetical protein
LESDKGLGRGEVDTEYERKVDKQESNRIAAPFFGVEEFANRLFDVGDGSEE